jgi:SAM-dependent methyltransferase
MIDQEMRAYYSGEKLRGDDFSISKIEEWFKEEEEGYANLGSNNLKTYNYGYHSLNKYHGFSKIPANKNLEKVLGIGSAYGYEFLPIIDKIKELHILEPSDHLKSKKLGNLSPIYAKPVVSGKMPYPDQTFDLVTSFGVLHHIPNVTAVLKEIKRVLKPGGIIMIREPIVSMGKWDQPRPNLTKNERGIPHHFFEQFFKENNFEIINKNFCFALTSNFQKIFGKFFKKPFYDKKWYIVFDAKLSNFLKWNLRYHQGKIIDKIAPTSVFFVASKKH